jgi:leucyl-tRNA synthetase
MQYNTVVSGCMKLLNALEAFKPDGSDGDAAVLCEGTSVLLRALDPACPHLTSVLWRDLGLEKATGAIQPIPTVVGPHFRRQPPLGGGHRPLGQQRAAQCR